MSNLGHDRQGSVTALTTTSTSHALRGTYTYDPYGQQIGTNEPAVYSPYRYHGIYLDTDLYQAGARYYDAKQGRFTQQDPVDGWSYHYSGSNPVNYTDEDGLYPTTDPYDVPIRTFGSGAASGAAQVVFAGGSGAQCPSAAENEVYRTPLYTNEGLVRGPEGGVRCHVNAQMLGGSNTQTHPYRSAWWSWPLSLRPVAYYRHGESESIDAIYALGNPALFWMFLPAVPFGCLAVAMVLTQGWSRGGCRRLEGAGADRVCLRNSNSTATR